MIKPEVKTYGANGMQHEYMRSKRIPLPLVSDMWGGKGKRMNNQELDIISRIDRILSSADARELNETEVGTLRDAKQEILRLQKALSSCAMDQLARMGEEPGMT
jgi:hypothetical protein